MAKTYSEELKIKAMAIAEKIGSAEASRATGVTAATIRSWIHRAGMVSGKAPTIKAKKKQAKQTVKQVVKQPPKQPAKKIDTKKMHKLQKEVMERAVAEAGEYVAERLKGLADNLYLLAEKAVDKVDVAISDAEELTEGKLAEPHNRDGAAWVRSLVGVMSQSIDKAQLLSGKPTVRPEVNTKHVYDITQRIINDKESVDLAEQLLRRAAGSDTSSLRVHSE